MLMASFIKRIGVESPHLKDGPPMASSRVLVFDFGNVIARFSHRRAAEALAAFSTAADPARVQAFCFGSELDDAFERGRVGAEDFRDRVRREFNLSCTDAAFDTAFADIFQPIGHVVGLARGLAGRVPLAVLSNTTPIHSRWFLDRMSAELAVFDHLVMSHDTGHRKPEAGIFSHVERLTGHSSGDHVLIDDLPSNIAGARAAGWDGIIFGPETDLAAELSSLGVVVS